MLTLCFALLTLDPGKLPSSTRVVTRQGGYKGPNSTRLCRLTTEFLWPFGSSSDQLHNIKILHCHPNACKISGHTNKQTSEQMKLNKSL